MIKRVVITGGPCAGKSSVLTALERHLADQAVFVPESISQLFGHGWPTPDERWTDDDWLNLQRVNTRRQLALEELAETEAHARRCHLVITDRAPYDNCAYPMGLEAVAERMDDNSHPLLRLHRYHLVIHLESMATAQPQLYGTINNAARYETLEQAQELELRARKAWDGHPNRVQLSGKHTIEELTTQVLHLIGQL